MTRQSIIKSLFTLLIMLTLAGSVTALDKDYKEYESSKSSPKTPYFEIGFDKSYVEFITYDSEGQSEATGFYRRDMIEKDNKILVDDRIIIDSDGLYINGHDLKWDQIYSIQVTEKKKQTIISFKAKNKNSKSTRGIRSNVYEYDRKIDIDSDEFIRGFVLAILGDVKIDGEVNRDVISLFGNIRLGGDAVARGDIVAMTGKVDVSKTASIYGEMFETKSDKRDRSKRRGRRGRFYRNSREYDFSGGFIYNRVDGAHPWFEYKFSDSDSLLPSVSLKGGYAFNSKRWRYNVAIEQTLLRDLPVTVGFELHRRLATEDNWLVGESENSVFAILANEDYMDYYEAEGGSAYIQVRPFKELLLEGRYQFDQTKWLPARHHLWSLFGGDKTFADNFNSVDDSLREIGKSQIDSLDLGSLFLSARFDNVSEFASAPFNGTRASFEFEWSDPSIDSDFDFKRYTLAATHYMRLNRRAMLSLSFRYGNSTGYLPMHKRFYLGGLSTLRGYKHKEIMGTEFWLANAEYRFELPGTSTDFAVIYDVAQITNDMPFDENTKVLHSVGISWYLSDDLHLTVAKRMDDGNNDDPRFLVRFTGGINWGVSTD